MELVSGARVRLLLEATDGFDIRLANQEAYRGKDSAPISAMIASTQDLPPTLPRTATSQ